MKTWRSVKAEKRLLIALSLMCCLGVLLGGCGPRAGLYPESTLGTPEHHVFTGFALMRMDRSEDAQREFEQALKLDPRCSGAYAGIAVVKGGTGDFAGAFALMGQANEAAVKNEEKALVEVGYMWLYTMQKGPGWVQRVERSFASASSLVEDLPEAYFQLGIAYKQASRFTDAERAFKKVIWIHGPLYAEAKEELESLRDLQKTGASSPSTAK